MAVKLILRAVLAAVLVLATVASVNYTVDPALVLRDGEYEARVAEGILGGKNVVLSDNLNERLLQRLLIMGLGEKPDAVVVGSSRAMLIPPDSLGAGNILCNGVSGAVIEDIIGVIALYDSRDMLPETVFISIDPWLFNASHMDTRYLELLEEYNSIAEKLWLREIPETISTKGWYIKIEQALSPTYFQASMSDLRHRPPSPVILDDAPDELYLKLSDGSVVYPSDFRSKTSATVSDEVAALINTGYIYHSTHYTALSPVVSTQFIGLINYLESCGVTIEYILSPLHPLLYEYVREHPDYSVFLEAEVFVRDFAEQRGIPVTGSFDPERVGALAEDFYDAYHPTREFASRLCENRGQGEK